MNNNITFNPNVTNLTLIQKAENKKIENKFSFRQQVSLSQFPSFEGRKPLSENEKCRQMLLKANRIQGDYLFSNDDIKDIMRAIENFKTDLHKSDLLTPLITFSNSKDNTALLVLSYISAQNLIDYFNTMSGKPANIQKYVATYLTGSDAVELDETCKFLTSNALSSNDYEYINKNLMWVTDNDTNSDEEMKTLEFATLISMFIGNQELAKYKYLILAKLNSVPATKYYCEQLCRFSAKLDAKNFARMLLFITPKNGEKVLDTFLNSNMSYKTCNDILSYMNVDNKDYLFEALKRDCDVAKYDIALLKRHEKTIPLRKKNENIDNYYTRVKIMLDELYFKENWEN